MALLPTPAKTHQWDHTTVAGQGSTMLADLRRGLRTAIVDKLLAKSSGAPTCKGSSNGTTAGMDNTNRWAADADLVWNTAGNAHSWIVLQFGALFHLCIDLANGTSSFLAAFISPTAFTGGSTTARPTSADEIQILGTTSAGAQWERGQTNIGRVYHVDLATDSSQLTIIGFDQNIQNTFWRIEVPANAVSGWTNPMYGGISPGSGGSLDGICAYSALFQSNGLFKAKGVSAMTLDYTTEAKGSQFIGQLQTTPNGLDGGYPLTACGLFSATPSNVGRHGSVVDLWAGSTTNNTGDTFPAGATRTFMTFGDIVLPWDGTVLTTA